MTPRTPVPIYLDHHATTPVDPRVVEVVVCAMTQAFGNPNSVEHHFGRAAANLLSKAAAQVAALVGSEAENVRFTSGASEALRLALGYASERAPGRPLSLLSSRIEHPALLDELADGERDGRFILRWCGPDAGGRVSPEAVAAAMVDDVDLVCMMAVNNEVGVIQPIREVTALAHQAGAAILVDATQAAGRVPLDLRSDDFDYTVLSGHKMYGPKGVGALIGPGLGSAPPPRRHAVHNATPNVPAIAGFGEAARLRRLHMREDEDRIARLRDRLETLLIAGLPGLAVNGDRGHRVAGNLHVSIPDAPNDVVVAGLQPDVAISTGAACASGVDAPSHVLQAMKLEPWRQDTALRFGLGRQTTLEEIERAAAAVLDVACRTRAQFRPAA